MPRRIAQVRLLFVPFICLLGAAGLADTTESSNEERVDLIPSQAVLNDNSLKIVAKRNFYFDIGRILNNDLPLFSLPKSSLFWYRNAAILGHPEALYRLGTFYRAGRHVPENEHIALEYWKMAAAQDSGAAKRSLAVFYQYRDDEDERIRWVRAAAEHGYDRAQFSLGLYYLTGNGVPQDFDESLKWYRLSASQGNASAQFGIGRAYAKGTYGGPPDYSEAFKWYQLAADKGIWKAQSDLATMYLEGRGVATDAKKGAQMMLQLARAGHSNAQLTVGDLYQFGTGVDRDLVAARKWLIKSVEQGNVQAIYSLGHLLTGEYTDSDLFTRDGIKWLFVAELSGHPTATARIDEVRKAFLDADEIVIVTLISEAEVQAKNWRSSFIENGGNLFIDPGLRTLDLD